MIDVEGSGDAAEAGGYEDDTWVAGFAEERDENFGQARSADGVGTDDLSEFLAESCVWVNGAVGDAGIID